MKIYGYVFILLCSFLCLSLTPIYTPTNFSVSTYEEGEPIVVKENLDSCKYWEFLKALGQRESLNNYQCDTNPYYKGKYQFGRHTRRVVGFGHLTNKEFLFSPESQEQAMYNLLRANEEATRKLIQAYEGKTIRGVYITRSGLLAGAHLAGAGGVYQFLIGGKDNKDWNNTKCSDYIKQFAGYEFDLGKVDIRTSLRALSTDDTQRENSTR